MAGKGGGRPWRALGALLVVLACVFTMAPAAGAVTLTVDHAGDQPDASPGTGGCATASEGCTLRAAIEEANASVGVSDRIFFSEAVFDGLSGATIVLGSSLPTITDKLAIESKECPSGTHHPCAGIEGPAAGPALIVHSAESKVFGLSIAGAGTGVVVEGAPKFTAQANWVGVKLDGSAGGDGTGIFIGPGSDNATVGSESAVGLNVFAGNAEDGLDIHGASGTKVVGNYFGVERDGTTALANGKDVEVTSVSGGGAAASGTTIGVKVNAQAAASAECDGGCNVISGSGASGIDLVGDGVSEAPAALTTVLGNYIGLDAGGGAALPNAGAGVRVGAAGQTVVGGLKSGEGNRINGGTAAVLAGPDAPDLLVRGNQIGLDGGGEASLAPPDEGVVVDSTGLSSPAVEAAIAGNAIDVGGGAGIDQQGYGATISGNEIRGAGTGIRTHGSDAKHGNLIEGNTVEDPQGSGIAVENELNEIAGNEVSGAGEAGILVKGSAASVSQNVVGGDAAAAENVVSGGAAAAIEINDVKASENEVARNRGIANGGLFIDLVPAPPGTEGPNGNMLPPAFASATEAGVRGGEAKPGARVRVFRKQLPTSGELQSFLGEAVADVDGEWQLSYGSPVPAGTIVAATQTAAGGTSELATTTTAGEAGDAGGGGGSGGAGGAALPLGIPAVGAAATPPQTWIVKGPAKASHSPAARFAFQADEPGSSFECSLDSGAFHPCRSPKAYAGLRPGKHVFAVRAIDAAGYVDPSPARKRFRVLSGKKGAAR